MSWATAEGEAAGKHPKRSTFPRGPGATVRTTADIAVARVWFGLDLLKAAEIPPTPTPKGLQTTVAP
ncbi:hypothetical protein GCM10023170_031870 [Phytohabitans houttuyneae]